MNPDEIRKQQLEEQVRQILDLIAEYEQKRDLASDPREKRRCERELQDLRGRLFAYRAELKRLTPPQDTRRPRKTAFISYSRPDAAFARRLAHDLKKADINIWFDRWEIKVGDSISGKIDAGLHDSDYLIIVLSPRSVKSRWVRQELNAARIKELEDRKIVVLPALIEKCELPLWLRDKRYADFRRGYERGLQELLDVLAPGIPPSEPKLKEKLLEFLTSNIQLIGLVVAILACVAAWLVVPPVRRAIFGPNPSPTATATATATTSPPPTNIPASPTFAPTPTPRPILGVMKYDVPIYASPTGDVEIDRATQHTVWHLCAKAGERYLVAEHYCHLTEPSGWVWEADVALLLIDQFPPDLTTPLPPTPTGTPEPTSTGTPEPTSTGTPEPAPTDTPLPLPTDTAMPTDTPLPPTPTETPLPPTLTPTYTLTPTNTPPPPPRPTFTPPPPTLTPTYTLTPTVTSLPPTSTVTPTTPITSTLESKFSGATA